MQTELFIEGSLADITADVAALFTYAVDDVADFSSRNTAFSKTIKLPGTAYNNTLFGNAFEFTAYNNHNPTAPNVGANFNAAKAARCLILIHGIQVFKGVIRLMKIVMDNGFIEYETAVFGVLGGLASAIGNKMLTGNQTVSDNLDFSAYDGQWVTTNIYGSWNAYLFGPTGSGVFYPLIDYGAVSTNKMDYKFTALRPALHVKEYIDKIFEKAGYTYECPFFSTDPFLRLIIPNNDEQLTFLTDRLIDATQTTPITHIVNESIFSTTGVADDFDEDIPFAANVLHLFTVNGTNTEFTYTGPAATSIYFNWRVRVSNLPAFGTLVFTVRINDTPVSAFNPHTYTINMASAGGAFDWYYFGQGIAFTINPSDVVTVHVQLIGTGNPLNLIDVTLDSAELYVRSTMPISAPVLYGETLQMSELIPKNILQRDLLLSIVKMFGLRLIEDPQKDKHLIIKTFAEFFDNSTPLDWTDKIDRSKEITLTPMSELNARYFNYLYDTDSDYFNELYKNHTGRGYGDYTLDTAFDFVKEKADLKIIFAPSPLVGAPYVTPASSYAGRDKYVTPIYKIEGGAEKPTASKIRILQAARKFATSWSVLNSTGGVISNTSLYGYAGHVDDPDTPQGADLNFGAPAEIFWRPANPYTAPGVFNVCHSAYMAEISDKDSKMLTCYAHLTPLDIYQLDFSKAVVIDGQAWRLNKAVDFDAVEENLTKCEFIKVINLDY